MFYFTGRSTYQKKKTKLFISVKKKNTYKKRTRKNAKLPSSLFNAMSSNKLLMPSLCLLETNLKIKQKMFFFIIAFSLAFWEA